MAEKKTNRAGPALDDADILKSFGFGEDDIGRVVGATPLPSGDPRGKTDDEILKDFGFGTGSSSSVDAPSTKSTDNPSGSVFASRITVYPKTGEWVGPAQSGSLSVNNVGRALATGVPVLGPMMNKADAATNALVAPYINPYLSPDNRLSGDTFSDRYDRSLAIQEGSDKAFAFNHPNINTGLNLTGGLGSYAAAGTIPVAAKLLGVGGGPFVNRLIASTASNAAIGGADTAARGGNPLTGAVVGGVSGAALPIAGSLGAAAAEPFTGAGRERIADRVIGKFANNTPPPAGTIVGADEIIPGSVPTLAQATGNVGLAGLERGMRNVPAGMAPFAERDANNAMHRLSAWDDVKGNDLTVQNLEAARDAVTGPIRDQAFANATHIDPGNVLDAIDGILASPSGQRDAVTTALKKVRDKLVVDNIDVPDVGSFPVLQTDPRQLYGIRQAIGDMLSKTAAASGSDAQLASRELMQVKDELDKAITAGASGFDNYLTKYAEMSKPIDTQNLLQRLNVTDTKGNVTLAKLDSQIKAIERARKAPGVNESKAISFEDMNKLYALRDDMRRAANSSLGSPIGSHTFQNIAINNVASQLGLPISAFGAVGSNNPAILAIGYGARKAYQAQNDRILEALTNKLLDPNTVIRSPSGAITSPLASRAPYAVPAANVGLNALLSPVSPEGSKEAR